MRSRVPSPCQPGSWPFFGCWLARARGTEAQEMEGNMRPPGRLLSLASRAILCLSWSNALHK